MLTPIKEKRVLITGGTCGIGKGMAYQFAQQGAQVILLARHLENTQRVVNELKEDGHQVDYVLADVADESQMAQAAKKIAKQWGGIDCVCANAGIYPSKMIESMSLSDWDTVINTNLRGTFLSVHSFLALLKQSDYGRVIITSSITGPMTGYVGWSHYAATKAGQLGFMRTAALELAPYGITVNAILPGNVLTEGLEELGEDYLQKMAASIPLKRLGCIDDIAYTALFLASKEAGFITGQTIVVDGGQTVPESLEAF